MEDACRVAWHGLGRQHLNPVHSSRWHATRRVTHGAYEQGRVGVPAGLSTASLTLVTGALLFTAAGFGWEDWIYCQLEYNYLCITGAWWPPDRQCSFPGLLMCCGYHWSAYLFACTWKAIFCSDVQFKHWWIAALHWDVNMQQNTDGLQ
jgi:hypothetical protein